MPWLPVAVLAVAQIAVRLISVAGMIWRERARAKANCEQMQTASASRVVFREQREDGTALLIAPHDLPDRGADAGSGMTGAGPGEASAP
jgi:hypothetical protein